MSRNCSWFERGLIEPWRNNNHDRPLAGDDDIDMERPASQLENMRPSGLKQPSTRLPALAPSSTAGRTLLETSQSDLNARTAMPPPPGAKHKISGLPEPPPKRKTLAERAGEPINPTRSHTGHLPKPKSTNTSHHRTGSTLANAYRDPSNASAASSTGSLRAQSKQYGQRAIGGRPPSVAEQRANVLDEEEEDAGVMGKRKGTPPVMSFNSATPNSGIAVRKTRARVDSRATTSALSTANVSSRSQHSGSRVRESSTSSDGSTQAQAGSRQTSLSSTKSQQPSVGSIGQPAARNVSLCTSFAELSITPKQTRATSGPKSTSTKHRPSLSPLKEELSPSKIPKFSCTPALRYAQSMQALSTPSPLKQKPSLNGLRTPFTASRRKDPLPVYLTKEKLTPVPVWDTKGRLEDMESLYATLRSQFAAAHDSKSALEESLALYKSRVSELNELNRELTSTNKNMTSDLERARSDLHTTTMDLRQARRDHERDMQDLERKHERELNDLYAKQEKEGHRLERELEKIAEQGERGMEDAKRSWQKQKDDETSEMTTRHWEEIDELKTAHKKEIDRLQSELAELRQSGESRATESATEVQALRDSLADMQGQLDAEKTSATTLRSQLSAAESRNASLEQEKTALISKAHFLEGNQEAQSLEFTSMSEKLQEAIDTKNGTLETLRREEMLRRKLNATILELRGNIRVFVRTRPLLAGEEQPARVDYPDLDALDGGKEMVVHAPTTLSATGKERNEKHSYAFDRVFNAMAANAQVFEECRDLIQSVVDGYNVSILSYGQTGSGKTFGMSGPDGIIPSAIALLLSEMSRLKEKGWEYSVDANFVEVYNETLNDLLGDAKTWDDADDMNASVRGKKKEKHEIHHDSSTGKTTVSNLSSISLWPPPENEGQWPPAASVEGDDDLKAAASYTEQAVAQLLDTAAKNRRVAATKANERSSRSHSIFMLTLRGQCAATGESSEGVLNLVDLAGSERLKQSGAEGNRMKETQAINKSLSALGDVIAALGSKKGDESHIPYRNSKLTYLLQSSLGGTGGPGGKSSRTLMLLHLSPLQAHWQESRSSLLFGSKVNGTSIGTATAGGAKRVSKA